MDTETGTLSGVEAGAAPAPAANGRQEASTLPAPPLSDPAIVVALTIALVRLTRGRGPSGLGWGPDADDMRSHRWTVGPCLPPKLITTPARPAAEHVADAMLHRSPPAALPALVVGLLEAHARAGSRGCQAVVDWVRRLGLAPGNDDDAPAPTRRMPVPAPSLDPSESSHTHGDPDA